MARLVSIFISAAYRRAIVAVVFVVSFLAAVAAMGSYAVHNATETMRGEALQATQHFVRLRSNLLATLDAMHAELTSEPCTAAFDGQLRRIAFRPDGLNEFLFAPGGIARCSASFGRFGTPVDLGQADIVDLGKRGLMLWMDRDLGFLGLPGERGTIVLQEPHAAIVPPQKVDLAAADWLALEAVLATKDGRSWHRGGAEGVYAESVALAAAGTSVLTSGTLHVVECDDHGQHCVAATAELAAVARHAGARLVVALLVAIIIAAAITGQVRRMIAHYWSFAARFCRHLNADSIVCAYQPVMNLDTGEITGCEVLARWRDLDGSLVFPDRFIGIVERQNLTMRFTELVAQRACMELSEHIPAGKHLQVNFNIFPRDLDCARLAGAYSGFTSRPDRFDVVLEIIESDAIPANAQRQIEALRRHGIKTYIDDFGTGYSNMQNLAALSVDGVKLDRAFAMAPENSMMAQMLRHAIEMIDATGRTMVVEGVETAERLALLRNMHARIDFVQGYFISRPLDAAAFAEFLKPHPVSLADRKRRAGIEIVAA